MIDRLFLAHPRSVDESYGEHFGVAWRFGVAMIGGGVAALLHAVVPALCARTGSTTIRRLHAEVEGRTPRAGRELPGWQLDYEI